MKQTMVEKILSRKAGAPVRAGAFVELSPDVVLANDVTAPPAIKVFWEAGGERVCHPERVVLMPDHFTPNKDIASAEQVALMRTFARKQGIERFFEIGRMGIEHVVLPEEGLVRGGDLLVGADSHTCTSGGLGAMATGVGSTDIAGFFLGGTVWLKVPPSIRVELKGRRLPSGVGAKDLILTLIGRIGVDGARYQVLEFGGEGVAALSVEGRLTVANMAVEAGAKTALFPVDERTVAWEAERGVAVDLLAADEGASYVRVLEIDLEALEPVVALPPLPSNVRTVRELEARSIPLDQVVIGSCTNGRIEDLRVAAEQMRGRTVAPGVRCLIFPGSQKVYAQALREGLLEVFVQAGCAISTPTCGPCLGGHMGILARGERALATTNRNFVGRMGHPESEVFLASPQVAAASALAGVITGPGMMA